MIGKIRIINTNADKNTSDLSDEQVIKMATGVVRYDDAIYPDNYDQSLITHDDGFIEPMYRFEDEIDQAVLDRVGVVILQASVVNK